MKILISIICCPYKEYSLSECIEQVKKSGFDDILLNFEGEISKDYNVKYLQTWNWTGAGKVARKYDQHQESRLPNICIARNMVMDFFQQTDYDYLLFVDSDVLIPADTKEKLFSLDGYGKIRSGLVFGRGEHSHAKYLFYPQEKINDWQKVDYATCGFLAIHRDVVFRIRFRWGMPKESDTIASEDPIFGSDTRNYLNEFWWVNLSLIAKHIGDLKNDEASQF